MRYLCLLLIVFSTVFTQAFACSELIGTCEYYLCREKEHACGSRGYYLDFAYKYCKKSEDKLLLKMDDLGQDWVNSVTVCLQKSVEKIPYDEPCKNVFNMAVTDHGSCYSDANFCELSLRERFSIVNMLKNELYHPQIIKQGLHILTQCRKKTI